MCSIATTNAIGSAATSRTTSTGASTRAAASAEPSFSLIDRNAFLHEETSWHR